jgi:hypothetical protein
MLLICFIHYKRYTFNDQKQLKTILAVAAGAARRFSIKGNRGEAPEKRSPSCFTIVYLLWNKKARGGGKGLLSYLS